MRSGNGGSLVISSGVDWRLFGCASSYEVSVFGANTMDHGEDELFDLVGLNLRFGEELSGAEAKLGHLGLGDLAAGVDDQRQGTQGRLLAKPFDQGETVAVGQGKVEDQQVRRTCDALPDRLLT